MSDLVDVTVKVPADRMGEFYELVGRWLHQPDPLEPATLQGTRPVAWTDSSDDLPLAEAVWTRFSARATQVISFLIEHRSRRFSAGDLADALDIPHGRYGIAGLLAWPMRYCAEVGRSLPISFEEGAKGEGGTYWVESDVADLFERVANRGARNTSDPAPEDRSEPSTESSIRDEDAG